MAPADPWNRRFPSLRLPADRKAYPPVVSVIVFLLWFHFATVLVVLVASWVTTPVVSAASWIGLAVIVALMALLTGLLVRLIRGGYLIGWILATALGVLGARSIVALDMLDVVGGAADVLLVVFLWTPAHRAYGRATRRSRRAAAGKSLSGRRGDARLPYRYAGPPPRREDFSTGE